jgi:peptidoglycan hydrolase CwlO-like protein
LYQLKLVTKGWAKPVDEGKLNDFISKLTVSKGTIKKILTTPINTDFGKLSAKVSATSYDFVFEVCASTQTLVSPEVLIRSESETKNYELVETIAPNTCVTSATIIKAANPDSITATLVSKGDVSQIVVSLVEKIDSLKEQLLDVKQSFGKENTNANKQQGNKIGDLRKQLNDAREDLHKLYFTMYTPSNIKLTTEKISFSGTPIVGETVTKISVNKSVATPDSYDVVFEVCAGEKQVRIPVIMVSSDKQNMDIKLGDKIAPNTCQMTYAKIGATNPESITVKVAGNAESSIKIGQLESKIADLTKQFTSEKELLKGLVHDPKRPTDFNEQLTKKTENISKLRNEIISAKGELSKLLYLSYR